MRGATTHDNDEDGLGGRLSAGPLGIWANPPEPFGDACKGVGLPLTPAPPSTRGTFSFEPALSAALWGFASRLLPQGSGAERDAVHSWVMLQARNDAVMWHLRAARLDPSSLAESIDLLTHLARYAETYDAGLSANLGQAAGVTCARRLQWQLALGAVCVVLLSIAIGALAMTSC